MRRNFHELTGLYRRVEKSTLLQGEELCGACGGKCFYSLASCVIMNHVHEEIIAELYHRVSEKQDALERYSPKMILP